LTRGGRNDQEPRSTTSTQPLDGLIGEHATAANAFGAGAIVATYADDADEAGI
jgi:hypothetical protein